MNIFNSLTEILRNFLNVISDIYLFFITPIEFGPLGTLTPISVMFGAGLVALLGVIVFKFFV